MPVRTKKLIGAAFILFWLPLYSFLVIGIAVRVLPRANDFERFLFYALAGMAWIVPIGLLLPWMSRPPRERRTEPSVPSP